MTISGIRTWLGRPISLQSLVAIRVLFGAIMLWDWWRYVRYERIDRYYVEPSHFFPYFGLDWLRPLPEPYIYWAWHLTGLCALLIMLGAFYRLAILGFILSFGYFFLLDRSQYLNHNYLVLLYAVLLAMAPAHRSFSIDAWLRPALRTRLIPAWPVIAIKAQTEIVLIYAGLVKITDDWLRGEPLGLWLRAQSDDWPFGWLFYHDAVILLGTWGTVALHVIGAPLLLWRRTRLGLFLIYATFHIANAHFFNIGIFPWLTIAVTTIFFAPDWPQRLARRLLALFEPLGPMPVAATPAPARIGPGLSLVLILWFAVQLFLPLRAGLFPGSPGWSGEGHRFSWRMRIYDRNAIGVFHVQGADESRVTVDPYDWLTPRQARTMLTRPDMIHDFAGMLRDAWLDAGHADAAVYAEISMSLNGRAHQPFIDPSVDLTAVPFNWFGPDPWILPMSGRVGR